MQYMTSTKSYTFRLPIDLMESIDQKRGPINRTRFVLDALEASIGMDAEIPPPPVAPQAPPRPIQADPPKVPASRGEVVQPRFK